MYNASQKTIEFADGRSIVLETGKLAKQADGSVVLKQGNTMLLATVVSASEAKEGVDFMPLTVEYKENFSAVGRYPGGFMKREAKPGDNLILVSRLIDRALRPLFPDDYHADTFVTVSLVSADPDIMPDSLAGLAASAALAVSDVPIAAPISEVRVARKDGKFIVNPTYPELEGADLDVMVAATKESILMVEGEMDEVSEEDMIEAIKLAHEEIKKHCVAQEQWAQELGVTKREYSHEVNDAELEAKVHELSYDKIYAVAKQGLPKKERGAGFKEIEEAIVAELVAEDDEEAGLKKSLIAKYFHDSEKKAVRNLVLDEGIRLDQRKTNEIRPIWCEVGYLPATHGSAVFTRGETQSLTTVTLGTKLDEKIIDEVMVQGKEKFVLHYNFPPFSTGDARPVRGISRREIGHGNLAFRALKRMIPAENPYAIRIVSDILESNGSSSMATVCAGTLALMDCGIKIQRPVSGIAMGLITDTTSGKFAVLSDILGDEDHLGDMDFKVTGTEKGITATQMDIKVDGLSYEILGQALAQAKEGRLHILGKITDTITAPREDYKEHVPRMHEMSIGKDYIGAVIGPGGKIIQEMQANTGTTITIEEVEDRGVVNIFGANKAAVEEAITMIKNIVSEPEPGEVYNAKVKSIMPYGAFVEIMPGKEGLLHISEIEWKRLEKVEDVLKEGDLIDVKLMSIDKKSGKFKLSRKVLLPKEETAKEE